MGTLFYNLFTSSDMLGGLMDYPSTEIICRYASIFCAIGVYALVVIGLLKIIKIILDL